MRAILLNIVLLIGPSIAYAQGASWELADELDDLDLVESQTLSNDLPPAAESSTPSVLSEFFAGGQSAGIVRPQEEFSLRAGLTENELIELFGEPDGREMSGGSISNRQSVWKYGDSTLFITDGKLVAWTNQESVLPRARLRGLSGPISKERGFKDASWRNAWQLREGPNSSDIIDELLLDRQTGGSELVGSLSSMAQSSASLELISGKSSTSSSEGSRSK